MMVPPSATFPSVPGAALVAVAAEGSRKTRTACDREACALELVAEVWRKVLPKATNQSRCVANVAVAVVALERSTVATSLFGSGNSAAAGLRPRVVVVVGESR